MIIIYLLNQIVDDPDDKIEKMEVINKNKPLLGNQLINQINKMLRQRINAQKC